MTKSDWCEVEFRKLLSTVSFSVIRYCCNDYFWNSIVCTLIESDSIDLDIVISPASDLSRCGSRWAMSFSVLSSYIGNWPGLYVVQSRRSGYVGQARFEVLATAENRVTATKIKYVFIYVYIYVDREGLRHYSMPYRIQHPPKQSYYIIPQQRLPNTLNMLSLCIYYLYISLHIDVIP